MRLKYRGVAYTPTLTETKFSGNIREGKYRGVPARYPMMMADVPSPDVELTYRGVTYRTGQARKAVPVAQESVAATTPADPAETLPMEERIRRLMLNHHHQIRKRAQSMLLRMGGEIGLSVDDASHFRSHIQGYIPHNEWVDYDRSHAAMS